MFLFLVIIAVASTRVVAVYHLPLVVADSKSNINMHTEMLLICLLV